MPTRIAVVAVSHSVEGLPSLIATNVRSHMEDLALTLAEAVVNSEARTTMDMLALPLPTSMPLRGPDALRVRVAQVAALDASLGLGGTLRADLLAVFREDDPDLLRRAQ